MGSLQAFLEDGSHVNTTTESVPSSAMLPFTDGCASLR